MLFKLKRKEKLKLKEKIERRIETRKGEGWKKGKEKEKIEKGKQVGSRVLQHARASVIGDVMVGKLLQDTLGPSPLKKSIAIGPNDISM